MFEQTSSEAPPDVRDARRRSTAVRFHTTLRARVHLSYYSLSLSNSTWTLAWVLCSGVHVHDGAHGYGPQEHSGAPAHVIC